MDEFWSFAAVIALWLGASCGLWWLNRRSVHAKQRRQMRQAVRAAAYVSDAQKIFDAIRKSPSVPGTAPEAALTDATHALLKRIQDRSAFFDKVNVLRVDMLAGFGIEDYPPLSEILHIRRDLWAASEIVLVEDLSSFGESFAEEGAYERFRAEAAALLFKADGAASKVEDLIDLRLSLARGEAERLAPELKDAIRLARERDRLPTFAEIIAYPVAAIRAIPGQLRIARTFISEFYGYAAEVAGAIRRSEAMERGVSELRRAREELPQRLVTGFERASDAARQSASGLRRHYDFLVAAHDFQAKYEQTLRRAPQITERGRQFIARLELAEHSERLRLTSANFLIWLTRQLATALAHFIAGLQGLHAMLSETPPGIMAAALVAPTPIRGRHVPAFRSYRMALGVSGLTEPRPQLPVVSEEAQPMLKKAGKSTMVAAPAKQQGKRGKGSTAKTPKPVPTAKVAKAKASAGEAAVAPPPAKAKKLEKPIEAQRSVDAPAPKSVTASADRPVSSADKSEVKAEFRPAPEKAANKAAISATPVEPVPAAKLGKSPLAAPPTRKRDAAKQGERADKPVSKTAALQPAPSESADAKSVPDAVASPRPAASEDKGAYTPSEKSELAPKSNPAPVADAETAEPQPASFPPDRRRSFLDRLFGRRPAEPTIGDLLAAAWEREHAAEAEAGDKVAAGTPPETAPTLLAKLSEIPEEDFPEGNGDESDGQDEPAEGHDTEDETGDDPESLTSSVMEVQAKLAHKPPQIRSFPWLRG